MSEIALHERGEHRVAAGVLNLRMKRGRDRRLDRRDRGFLLRDGIDHIVHCSAPESILDDRNLPTIAAKGQQNGLFSGIYLLVTLTRPV